MGDSEWTWRWIGSVPCEAGLSFDLELIGVRVFVAVDMGVMIAIDMSIAVDHGGFYIAVQSRKPDFDNRFRHELVEAIDRYRSVDRLTGSERAGWVGWGAQETGNASSGQLGRSARGLEDYKQLLSCG